MINPVCNATPVDSARWNSALLELNSKPDLIPFDLFESNQVHYTGGPIADQSINSNLMRSIKIGGVEGFSWLILYRFPLVSVDINPKIDRIVFRDPARSSIHHSRFFISFIFVFFSPSCSFNWILNDYHYSFILFLLMRVLLVCGFYPLLFFFSRLGLVSFHRPSFLLADGNSCL